MEGLGGPPGISACLRIHTSDVSSALQDRGDETSILNIFPAQIAEIRGDGPTRTLRPDLGKTTLLASLTHHSVEHLRLREGQRVYAQVKTVALID
jgi:molybdate transport system ATP-binding protein